MKKLTIFIVVLVALAALGIVAIVVVPIIYPSQASVLEWGSSMVAPHPPPPPQTPEPNSPIVSAMRKAHPDYIIIPGVEAKENIKQKVDVVYPDNAMSHRIQGTVVMFAAINEYGSVVDLVYVSGNDLLKNAALDGVKHYKYKPFLVNGKPTGVITTIHFVFNLGP